MESLISGNQSTEETIKVVSGKFSAMSRFYTIGNGNPGDVVDSFAPIILLSKYVVEHNGETYFSDSHVMELTENDTISFISGKGNLLEIEGKTEFNFTYLSNIGVNYNIKYILVGKINGEYVSFSFSKTSAPILKEISNNHLGKKLKLSSSQFNTHFGILFKIRFEVLSDYHIPNFEKDLENIVKYTIKEQDYFKGLLAKYQSNKASENIINNTLDSTLDKAEDVELSPDNINEQQYTNENCSNVVYEPTGEYEYDEYGCGHEIMNVHYLSC